MSLAAERGERAETLAAARLQACGLKLLARNQRSRFGEIDLVMEDGATLVFVEVRYRAHADFGGAAASVTAAKRARLELAIRSYLAAHPAAARKTLRADVVAITGADEVEWIQNAFEGMT
ncbi:MAG: YraN family protein [Gammaproteobacteria bacterium]